MQEITNNNTQKNYKKNTNQTQKRKIPTSGNGWTNNTKKAFEYNEKSHQERLDTNSKLNFNTKASIKITPIGGLNEIGGNMMVVETNKSAIIIDVGMSFPDDSMHGVDILIPDISYIKQIRNKIAGICITHAHEDHIGAMPYFFKEIQVPLYATPLPLEMIGAKFDEHKIAHHRSYFRAVTKRRPVKIGDFEVEWIHITHSIIDCSALAITTEAGTIIHTGDFKIDHTPVDDYPTDLHRLAYYGEKGVLALLSDSTNSHTPGMTKSEKVVGATFDKIFAEAKGRIIMSTFSSNIHRVAQAIDRAIKYGRKICVIGRSMEKNIDVTIELGYLNYDKKHFIDMYEVNKYPDNQILIVTTGSQGEPMSALFRMSIGEHRHVRIKPEDQIILSSKAIPGNEGSVSEVINQLLKAGAKVAYQDYTDIHVSGHASQEDQKLMIRLTKPKFFLPVHGEYNHVLKHAQTAQECGIPQKNIYIMSDGEQVEITPKYLKKTKTVKTGKIYIDNQQNQKIADDVVLDRQKMASDGMVVIVAQINKDARKIIAKPRVVTFGLVDDKNEHTFTKEIEEVLNNFLTHAKTSVLQNNKFLEEDIRKVVRKHCIRKYKKYPLIVPTILV